MKNQIQIALTEAKATAVMITQNCWRGEYTPERIAAITAIANAENSSSPCNDAAAEEAALVWLVSEPELAMTEINTRIAARAAKTATSEAAQRALRGED